MAPVSESLNLQPLSVTTNTTISAQPEPSILNADEMNKPYPKPRIVSSSVTASRNGDFVSGVMSGALATAQNAIDVAANAGRTAYSTLETLFIAERDNPAIYYQTTAQQDGDVTLIARGSPLVSL